MKFKLLLSKIIRFKQRSVFSRCSLYRESASVSLPLLFSTIAGILFTLLFFNLVRYVAAMNAVEQAALKTLRCLTPTDPECVTANFAASPVEVTWNGYKNPPQHLLKFASRYRYGAKMFKEKWAAALTTYQQHIVTPHVSWKESEVARKEFSLRLNPYVRRAITPRISARAILPGGSYRAQFSQFTDFDSGSGDLPVLAAKSFTQEIERGANFRTDWVNIPSFNLSFDSQNSIRSRSDGSAWRDLVVRHGGGQNDWHSLARIAIRYSGVFSGVARVRWDLLFIEVCDQPDGQGFCSIRDLGGVDWRDVAGVVRIDPNIRGPEGSHGGGTPGDHENIVAPRGGSIRIGANILARSRVNAEIGIVVEYDGYNESVSKSSPITKVCPRTVICPTDKLISLCPKDLRVCGFSSSTRYTDVTCLPPANSLEEDPLCEMPSDKCAFPVSDPITQVDSEIIESFTKSITLCSLDFQPQIPDSGSNREFCLVEKKLSPLTVADVPAGCTALSSREFSKACDNTLYSSDFNFGNPLKLCPGLTSKLDANNSSSIYRQIELANKTLEPNAPRFPQISKNNFSWLKSYSGESWQKIWKLPPNVKDAVKCCSVNSTKTTCKTNVPYCADDFYTREPFKFERFSKSLESAPPTQSDFRIEQGVFLTSPPNNLPLVLSSTTEEIAIKEVYPFSKEEEFEIISPDFKYCKRVDHSNEKELELALRAYAAKQIPQALDQSVSFEAQVKLKGEAVVEMGAHCNDLGFKLSGISSCIEREVRANSESCTESGIFLGTFRADQFLNGPSACNDGTYAYCSSSPFLPTADVASELEINSTKALSSGYREIVRAFPGYGTNCIDEPGCSLINIDTDGLEARVEASLNFPLTFPFNIIMGLDSAVVTSTKHEGMELKMFSTKH